MTPEEIRDICDLLTAAGRTHVPVAISEWREFMATKSIGRVSAAELAKGKVKPASKTPKHFRIAKEAKAGRAAKKWAAKSK